MTIREFKSGDWPALQALYRAAFPEEDLLPLLRDLTTAQDKVVNYVSVSEDRLVAGHIALTICHAEHAVALLAPLAVAPDCQRQGIGTALISHAFEAMINAGVAYVCVLGDPGYYRRHGFSKETQVLAPYALPQEWETAWQGRSLADGPRQQGKLVVPAPWQDPALWA